MWLRDCILLKKVLGLGIYRFVYGNLYVSNGFVFNVGKFIVIEVV